MLMGLGIGIPYRYSSGVGGSPDPLTLSEFYAPLTHSLFLTRGTGYATYSRATTAWEFDNEGKLVTVPTGIPRFGGARFNGADTWYKTDSGGSPISAATLLGYHSEGARTNSLLYSRDLTNAAWAATNVTAAKTATGIDNAANSASTLTAGADNATILQTLTLASAARSSSAYVKRRTGTGTISFTRNGGTTWTDITSLINDATWTRVKIENTSVTNPSIGFKLATSGDAIDVDIVQDEAGAFCSSPIITTTAAVTRNAEYLSYSTTSNVNSITGSICFTNVPSNTLDGTAKFFLTTPSFTGIPVAYSYPGNKLGMHDGTSWKESTLNMLTTSSSKYASSWDATVGKVAKDGVAYNLGASLDGSLNAGATIDFRQINDALYGTYVKETHIWQSALTDEQLQTVTS